MTELQWLSSTDPQTMLKHVRKNASARKQRLFAVACCRQVWHLLTDERSLKSVETAEERADNPDMNQARLGPVISDAYKACEADTHPSVAGLAHDCLCDSPITDELSCIDPLIQCSLLREIVGNPFRSVRMDPAWLAWEAGTVVNLAQTIYDERAYDRIPIVADALEDAGCNNEEILRHCRGEGPHVRGCWVVDLLTGRE